MPDHDKYVHPDQHGVLRIGATRVMLDSVLAAWDQGHSPETIRSQYPSLTLEEVYGAIAWSLSHAEEVAQYLQRQNAAWEHWQQRSERASDRLRLRLRSHSSDHVARGFSMNR